MRPTEIRYPVDRYLVESSKQIDMVNIIDDDIWNSESALRPEDEIILRKLHDMLQSTADDLKLLSGELSKYHESDIKKKTLPTPLDEEFNEKVHIEEVVKAKFYGHKVVESESTPNRIHKDVVDGIMQSISSKRNTKQFVNHGVQVNHVPILKKSSIKRNLGVSRTNVIQIGKPTENNKSVNSNEKTKKKNNNTVSYNEFSYKYVEPKSSFVEKPLEIQTMPCINIRSELKEQKVVQLDINPENKEVFENETNKSNALVIDIKHEDTPKPSSKQPITFDHIPYIPLISDKPVTRKVTQMSVYESESTNNVSSESQDYLKNKTKTATTLRSSPKSSHTVPQKTKKYITNKKDVKRESKRTLDEWQKKLNAVYGGSSKSKSSRAKVTKVSPKRSGNQKVTSHTVNTSEKNNNTEYIPYSKLTVGGVNASDIEREISNIRNRGEIVLSPILDKILSSRENSFQNDSPRKNKSSKILTTSDENLLQDVIDIEKEITTISMKNENNNNKKSDNDQINKNHNYREDEKYDDDFEDEKSNDSEQAKQSSISSNSTSSDSIRPNNSNVDENCDPYENQENKTDQGVKENIHNKTYTKISNLSFKNTVDIFEFVHSVGTQDTGTQFNASNKAPRQENQTSSSEDKSIVQPIRNDLWPSIDPRGEVEKMFKLEKEFIKKLILDEYGDLLEKQLNKPSTSGHIGRNNSERNFSSSQKNTQTSPARVKSVMTSPTITKTRTTSPFALSLSDNQQTSPIVVLSKGEQMKVEIENNDDLGISVNLSSPRFSLRLPQTSRDVLSNMKSENSNRDSTKRKTLRRNVISSSSSGEGDYTSSDISSLGQIDKFYKRRFRKSRIPSISEISSSSSSLSRYSTDRFGAIVPLKSEGEASIAKINAKRSNKLSKSEGEMSIGQLN